MAHSQSSSVLPDPDFSGCLERLDWASEALSGLHLEMGAWIAENDVYESTVEYHPEADIHAFRLVGKVPPQRLGVIVGNVIHQVRASLDNLVWQLVIANKRKPTGGQRGNNFPIYTRLGTKKDPKITFEDRAAGALEGVHPDHVAVIKGLQPYHRPSGRDPRREHPLGVLTHLSNRDKHQVLQLMAAGQSPVSDWKVKFTTDTGRAVEGGLLPSKYLDAGAVIAWCRLDPPGHHGDVKMQTLAWVALMSIDPPNPSGLELTLYIEQELRWIIANVRAMVEAFLPITTGGKVEPVDMKIEAQVARYKAHYAASPEGSGALTPALVPWFPSAKGTGT